MRSDEFISAIYRNDHYTVQRLLNSGIDVNCLGSHPRYRHEHLTPAIMMAVESGNNYLVKQLLERGADPNQHEPANHYHTALGIAAENGHVDIVNSLLRGRADINALNSDGHTALHEALQHQVLYREERRAVIDALLAAGADPKQGKETMHAAVSTQNVEIVRQLIAHGADVNEQTSNWYKETPLIHAAKICHERNKDAQNLLPIIDLLIKEKADINQLSGRNETALGVGASNTEVVKRLLAAGANPNPPINDSWDTPLIRACYAGNLETVDLLLAAGADPSKLGNAKRHLLTGAAKSGNAALVTRLQNLGIGDDGMALIRASEVGNIPTVERLLESGAKTDTLTSAGYTALDWAVRQGEIDTVATLISAGAKLSGNRPLEKLLLSDHRPLQPLLSAMLAPDFRTQLADAVRSENPALAEKIVKVPPQSTEEKALMQLYARAQLTLSWDKNSRPFPKGIASLLQTPGSFTEMRRALKDVPLEHFKDVKDMHTEFATYVLLPSMLIQSGITQRPKQLNKLKPLPLIASLTPIAAGFLANGHDLISYLKFSESWHKPHHAFPSDRLRPLMDRGVTWHPLTANKTHVVPKGEPAAGWEVTVLTSVQELEEEGAALKHCVGGSDYSLRCQEGKTHLISIRDPEGNRVSTGELSNRLEGQHRAEYNKTPPEEAQQARAWFINSIRSGRLPLSEQHGETAVSKLKKRESAILRSIGFHPTWGAVDQALKHYQSTVSVKHNLPDKPTHSVTYPGGGWQKSIIPEGKPRVHFRMQPLVSGHVFMPNASGNEDLHATGETKFLSDVGAQELLDISGLTAELKAVAEAHGISVEAGQRTSSGKAPRQSRGRSG